MRPRQPDRRQGRAGLLPVDGTYEAARVQTAARGVGVAQAAYECAVKYAKERTQFGVPIGNHQVIRHKLAHMAVEIEAARQLAYFAVAEGHRQALRLRGRSGQGLRRRDGRAGDARGDAGARRLRLLDGVQRPTFLARRAGAVDLRGYQRNPARSHRPPDHGAGTEREYYQRRQLFRRFHRGRYPRPSARAHYHRERQPHVHLAGDEYRRAPFQPVSGGP